MSGFIFEPSAPPFRAWLGPYTPARGVKSGFRVHERALGAWITEDDGSSFWTVARSSGVSRLEQLVVQHFGGGRVLLLPDGYVVKPLNRDEERGRRVVIGVWGGVLCIESAREYIDFSDPEWVPGCAWPGPATVGLECTLGPTGSLCTRWWRPTSYGEEATDAVVRGPDPVMAAAFQRVRHRRPPGRVRVTAHGLVLTNRAMGGAWRPYVVGRVDTTAWPHRPEWMGGPIR